MKKTSSHKDKTSCCCKDKHSKPAKAAKPSNLDPVSETPIENINDHPLSHLANKYGLEPYEFPVTTED